ncbi:Malate synthase [Populus alba x Populus x berolinensis]|uniref:malate synthase n=2 Tax=Populus TaxID=3689 RepID=A0A4U5MHT9_POPAL|nr:Malate synthase [Populus alba x Populus x berolinensis]TKR68878.1 Malate synthase, glyoxysomal [Populus alba]
MLQKGLKLGADMMGNLRRSLPRMLCNLFLICRESLGTASSLQWSVARKPKGGIMRGLYQGLIQLQGTSGKVIGHVRPRGWHLPEAHILIDGEPATGCLVDFGLYFYHNYAAFRRTRGAGFGPFLYLPKMEHSREAKIWNFVFEKTKKIAGIERGSIRATVLILYELRDHSVGLIVEDGITSSAMPRHSRLTQIACYQTGFKLARLSSL